MLKNTLRISSSWSFASGGKWRAPPPKALKDSAPPGKYDKSPFVTGFNSISRLEKNFVVAEPDGNLVVDHPPNMGSHFQENKHCKEQKYKMRDGSTMKGYGGAQSSDPPYPARDNHLQKGVRPESTDYSQFRKVQAQMGQKLAEDQARAPQYQRKAPTTAFGHFENKPTTGPRSGAPYQNVTAAESAGFKTFRSR
jgi:hypothetical protein